VKKPGLVATLCLLVITAGVIACGGSKVDLPALATAAADATPSAALEITAKGTKFDKDTLVASAKQEIVLRFNNQDASVQHNVSVYTQKDAKQILFRGDLFEGKQTREYRFRSPEAGVYYFRCDVHPAMDGVFIAK